MNIYPLTNYQKIKQDQKATSRKTVFNLIAEILLYSFMFFVMYLYLIAF